jgi:anti-anti-sigma regulatory factor
MGGDRPGRLLRIARREPSVLRILLLLSISVSFVLGAAFGALAFHWNPSASMLAPVAFLGWIVWVDLRTPIADVREIDAFDDPSLTAAGIVRELLPPEVALYRLHHAGRHGAHRAPDFHLWTERLPAGKRVLVLSLSPATRIDENAAMDLREGAESLRRAGRRLVVGGVTPAQYAAFERHGVLRTLAREDVFPDLEFALARAVSLASGHQV